MDTTLGRLNANASDLPNAAGLESLRHAAAQNDPAAIAATAQKFEGLFAQEMIKSMRAASGPDSMFPGQSQTYRDLYDKEVAAQMTRGKGLGLQAMIRQSLGGQAAATSPMTAAAAAPGAGKPATGAVSATSTHFTPRTSAVAVPSATAALARMTGKSTSTAAPSAALQRASAPGAAASTAATLSASARASLRAASPAAVKQAALPATSLVRSQKAAMSLANYRRVMPAQVPVNTQAVTPAAGAAAATVSMGSSAAAPHALNTTQAASVGATSRAAARALPVSTASSHSLSNPGSGRQPPHTVGSPTPLPSGAPNRSFSPEDFVAKVWPHAQRAAAALGVAPEALVAQAALETGWGKYVGASNNLFGIKAGGGWKGATQTLPTSEVRNGQMQTERAAFRSYASIGDSFDDYVKLLKGSPRYAAALGSGNDTARFAGALQKAGYATDPAYASKIAALARTPMLAQATLQKAAGAPLIASR